MSRSRVEPTIFVVDFLGSTLGFIPNREMKWATASQQPRVVEIRDS